VNCNRTLRLPRNILVSQWKHQDFKLDQTEKRLWGIPLRSFSELPKWLARKIFSKIMSSRRRGKIIWNHFAPARFSLFCMFLGKIRTQFAWHCPFKCALTKNLKKPTVTACYSRRYGVYPQLATICCLLTDTFLTVRTPRPHPQPYLHTKGRSYRGRLVPGNPRQCSSCSFLIFNTCILLN
jgi:hypothetical protein